MNGTRVTSRVWRDGTRLMARTEGQEAEELLPESEALFFSASEQEEGSPDNIFERDASGRVVAWIYKAGDVEFRSVKMK